MDKIHSGKENWNSKKYIYICRESAKNIYSEKIYNERKHIS